MEQMGLWRSVQPSITVHALNIRTAILLLVGSMKNAQNIPNLNSIIICNALKGF